MEKEALILEKPPHESYKNIEQKAAGRVKNWSCSILSSRRTSGLTFNEIAGNIIRMPGDNRVAVNKDDLIKDETAILGNITVMRDEGFA
ncbi:MAG: hypothetical protein LBG43_06270 [Treponema sp.]|nr:hypothetical protein [Treponema sp.]